MSPRKYYSVRTNPQQLTPEGLFNGVRSLYLFFKEQDYFKGLAGITRYDVPERIKHKASFHIHFQPFPIEDLSASELNEDRIFDLIEFLHDHASKPGELTDLISDTGWNYQDYVSYDETEGRKEFREHANQFLNCYGEGYELATNGEILRIGRDGTSYIHDVGIIPYNEENVDSKVRNAIHKWRSRNADISERKAAILELANVFEWLKKTHKLQQVMTNKDESALFDIANNFALRHHNPKQLGNYDESIWYAWIFHFYLATYHAVIRTLTREENK